VFIAVPLEEIPKVAASIWSVMQPSAVLTDVGSVKSNVMAEVEGLGGRSPGMGPAFIGGHPMAGSEREGLDGADGTIFQGAAYVLTPSASAPAEAFNRLASFVRLLGARVIAVDAATHDRLVGIVSHLPQVVASALMAFAAETARADPGLLAMAGGGFRDVTRVAASSPDLWTGILSENREAVLDALEGFAGVLGALRTALAAGDWAAVRQALGAGRDARALLPGKAVDAPVIDVVIPVHDRPGSLAAVTTALGAVGINIEDVSMRHAEDSARGALVVAVAGEDTAERARLALAARGFPSHLETR
ncbi:MAG: prephenate dehydrogenase/arogenate dehydrogenase family protein, partial [Actinomycetota bacterium]|nr:prephenate dehydrogenase/arogenate dehydrogenase family protein [Actinomycetota bacterium]